MIFEKAKQADKEWLTEVMTRAFNFDTMLHRTDTKEDGPPGYNDGSLTERMLADTEATTYVIILDKVRVGFLNIQIQGTTGSLEKFCLDPDFIGQGIGLQAWQLLEQQELCQKWQLETPDYSVRNHRFYERCGFKKTGMKKYGENSYSIIFEKELNC